MPRRKVSCRKVIDRLMPEASQDNTKFNLKRIQKLHAAIPKISPRCFGDVQFQNTLVLIRPRPSLASVIDNLKGQISSVTFN